MNFTAQKKEVSLSREAENRYKKIYSNYTEKLRGYAHTFVCNVALSEDVVQDVFVKFLKLDFMAFTSSEIDKYLYRSVKNACIDCLRKQEVRNKSRIDILNHLLERQETYIPQIELDELSKKIQNGLHNLPKQTHKIFAMSRISGKNYKEIATELNLSVKSIEYHMSKALHVLKTELKDYLPTMLWIVFIF